MKKTLQKFFCTALAVILFGVQTMAYTNTSKETNLALDFDEAEIYTAFDEVNELIALIENDNNITYNYLETTNSEMVANVSSSAAIAIGTATAGSPPFISAFLWGCIFNLPGMLIVGITTDFDNEQLKKSAWGCLISTLIWGSGGLFF